ncbi:MAG: PAS domain S-box protein [Hyphomicrobiaceae bacterium]
MTTRHTADITAAPLSMQDKWQSVVDILASFSGFAAALIMRVNPPEIEVFASSRSQGNPYVAGKRANLDAGLCCETVMATRMPLHVPDARTDPHWDQNPDLALGMNCYYGMPLLWPDGKPFGTICILNDAAKALSPEVRSLMGLFREIVENDLKTLCEPVIDAEQQDNEWHEARERYAAIFEQGAIGIARVGIDGTWLEVNDQLCRILGYSRPEIFHLTFQDITHADDLTADLIRVDQLLKGEIQTTSFEKRYIHKRGHVVWALLTVSLVRDRAGKPLYFIAFIEDITDKKVLQKEVEQAQKLEALGRLAGGIAHEFNNKLAAITGNLFMASRHKERADHFVQEAEGLCFQASELIRGLLTYARSERLEKKSLRFDALISKLSSNLKVVLAENVQLQIEVSDEPFLVLANPTQLQQIVLNLITNAKDAVEFTADPKVVLRLDAFDPGPEQRKLHPSMTARRFARLQITDNGEGIADNRLGLIFDPFYTTKPVGKGTGLGLALVTSLVEQHDGIVDVQSVIGAGTTFTIYLPLLDEQERPMLATGENPISQGNGQVILLVDDNQSVLEVTSEVLQTLGYKVVSALHGEDALAKYKSSGEIACVLTDVVMPRMGGVELWKRLAAYDEKTRVIFMTGYDSHAEIEGLNCPVLTKPIAVSELSRTLSAVLAH